MKTFLARFATTILFIAGVGACQAQTINNPTFTGTVTFNQSSTGGSAFLPPTLLGSGIPSSLMVLYGDGVWRVAPGNVLPSQTGNSGLFLTTNGVTAFWAAALTTVNGTTNQIVATSVTGGYTLSFPSPISFPGAGAFLGDVTLFNLKTVSASMQISTSTTSLLLGGSQSSLALAGNVLTFVGSAQLLSIPGTIVAQANNDSLYGVRINPTLNIGTFTGMNYAGLILNTPNQTGTGTYNFSAALQINLSAGGFPTYAIYTNDGLVRLGNTLESTTATNGSITTAGGMGIAKSLNVGLQFGVGGATSARAPITLAATATSSTGSAIELFVSPVLNASANSDALYTELIQPTFATTSGGLTGLSGFSQVIGTPSVTGTSGLANSYQLYIAQGAAATAHFGIFQAGTDPNTLAGPLSIPSLTVTSLNGFLVANGNSAVTAATSSLGMRNRIVNGDMRIDQANAGGSVTVNTTANIFTLDKWKGFGQAAAGAFTVQRSFATPPGGYSNYVRLTTTTADAAPAAGTQYVFDQPIEGTYLQDFQLGVAANTQSFTFSFWVRSSLTGSFSGSFRGAAFARSYPFSYTIASANTWQFTTVVVPSDTTGAWVTDSTLGMLISFDLGCGSTARSTAATWQAGNFTGVTGAVRLVATNAATFDLTGVQLEPGTFATPFEQRPQGDMLRLCQREYQKSFLQGTAPAQASGGSEFISAAGRAGAAQVLIVVNFPVLMRAAPAVTTYNPGALNANIRDETGSVDCSAVGTFNISERAANITGVGNAATVLGNVLGVHATFDSRL